MMEWLIFAGLALLLLVCRHYGGFDRYRFDQYKCCKCGKYFSADSFSSHEKHCGEKP